MHLRCKCPTSECLGEERKRCQKYHISYSLYYMFIIRSSSPMPDCRQIPQLCLSSSSTILGVNLSTPYPGCCLATYAFQDLYVDSSMMPCGKRNPENPVVLLK